jgi:glycosyltransferase involved in cell wall biosynthesis
MKREEWIEDARSGTCWRLSSGGIRFADHDDDAVKLSIVLTTDARGGTPNRMASLATALVERGWEVQVISLMPAQGLLAELEAVTSWTDSLNIRRGVDLRSAPGQLRTAVKAFTPDVVQTALFHANVMGRICLQRVGAPIVSGYQSLDLDMGLVRRTADRLTAPLAERHVAVSRAVADRVAIRARVPRDHIDVIPIGKELPRPTERSVVREMLAIPSGAVVVGFVGRLHPVKNIPILVEACEHLSSEVWLLVVGDGPDRQVVEGRPRTVVTGMQREVGTFLGAMDVFVLPSRWEGMPGALIEAMAAGLPVVATSVGGAREVISDGVDGYLVEPGSATRLAGAIGAALANPGLGHAAARTARQHFSLDAMVSGYVQVYTSLVNSRHSRAANG